MKYGPGITLKYGAHSYGYNAHGNIFEEFCSEDLCKALGVPHQNKKLRLIAHNRYAEKLVEVYVADRNPVASLARVTIDGGCSIQMWIFNEVFHDLGIKPKEDTYFWLEVKQ